MPFECETCHKQFSRTHDLKRHILTHTGEKPFECEICKHRYAHNSHLKVHLRTHTGEKPYKCEICNTNFGLKSTLKSHLLRHTGEKPYECHICNKKYKRRTNYSAHFWRIHPGEEPIKNGLYKNKSPLKRIQSDLNDYSKSHIDEGESCNLKINSKNKLKLEENISDVSDANDSMQPDIKLVHIKIEEINSEINSHTDDDVSFDLKLNSDSKLNLQEDMSDVRLNDSLQPDIKLELLHEDLNIKLEKISSDED